LTYNNILIIQTAFIGDAILASCLIEKLRSYSQEARISVLVRKGNESIYENHPYLKEVLVWDKSSDKTKNLFSLLFSIRRKKFDLVVNCHRYASSGFLTAFSGAHHKAGFKQTPFAWMFNYAPKHSFLKGEHEIDRYHKLVEDFAGTEKFLPRIYPTESDIQIVSSYKSALYYCIAPSSVWYTKQLPMEKWVELCNLFPAEAQVYVLGAAGDEALTKEIITRTKHKNLMSLCGKLSLLQSAELMRNAKMNFVNDSAPLHLASSVNAPVRAFFCSTTPDFGFFPLSDKSGVIESAPMDCKPCGIHGFKQCPKEHFNCGKGIEITSHVIQ